MKKELWKQILENQDARQALSKLRKELKENGEALAFSYMIAGQEAQLAELLKNEDAKTRKNAALLMGELGNEEFLKPLYEAYQKEKTLFVKSSYLIALKNLDYRDYVEDMKLRLKQLSKEKMLSENQKHLTEETRQLSELIITMEGVKTHKFQGMDETYDVILLTNRNHQWITTNELIEQEPQAEIKEFGAGLMAQVKNLHWKNEIRTYQELLFTVQGMQNCPMEPKKAAEVIVNSELMSFLIKGHGGKVPFYFRVELKSKKDLKERSTFAKKLSSEIERLSMRKLINTTSHYEFEIRLIENKQGSCNVLVKLYALKDVRFTYRKEVIPTSIKPVNAALTIALAKDYMKEDAQVLDPFCGVGTMLIERHKAVRANTTYGIDFSEEAIVKAKINTEIAHQVIHYVNRNFFDFSHEYLFDEIVTNMPFRIGRKTEEEICELYELFFPAAKKVLKEHGIIVMYTHDRDYAKQEALKSGFVLREEYEISKKEGTYVMIAELQE